ncbi:MAG TPA: tryptophan--tRNA ligase [bacterium]|jgi:tryptophanyl-tRNA synthetase|nr:tryptophan--tRNA ligase [bacterium]
MAKISLTGIKPTGVPHLGNYLGSIQPALELAKSYLSVYFIADWHALTTIKDGKELRPLIHQLAATWLACGLDPEKTVFFQQSRVPELGELNWYLACFTAKGVLNRAHAYKALVSENLRKMNDRLDENFFEHAEKQSQLSEEEIVKQNEEALPFDVSNSKFATKINLDEGINAGVYTYPVLMAADILLFGSDVVPVGQDQKQHVEIARDIAESVNRQIGSVFKVPEPLIGAEVKTIPGLDGRKMSKSYDNVIPLFAPAAEVRKAVMRIVTDSKRPEDPKDPETCNVFNIFRHFADADRVEERRKQYLAGGVAYGEMKEELAAALETRFGAARRVYEDRLKDPGALDRLLDEGAVKARKLAGDRMDKIRKKLGLR